MNRKALSCCTFMLLGLGLSSGACQDPAAAGTIHSFACGSETPTHTATESSIYDKNVQRLFDAADRARAAGNLKQSELLYLEACRAATSKNEEAALIDGHVRLADLYLHCGRLGESRKYARLAMKGVKSRAADPFSAIHLADLCDAYEEVFVKRSVDQRLTHKEAEWLLQDELELREAVRGPKDKEVKDTRGRLVRLYLGNHQWQKAIVALQPVGTDPPADEQEATLQLWLEELRKKVGSKNQTSKAAAFWTSRNAPEMLALRLGEFYYSAGDNALAEKKFKEALAGAKRTGKRAAYAQALVNLGFLYKQRADYANAEKYCRLAMQSSKPGDADNSQACRILVEVFVKSGRPREAEPVIARLNELKKERRMDELKWFTVTGEILNNCPPNKHK